MIAAVQTTGINAEAIAATLLPLLTLMGAGLRWIAGRLDTHHAENVEHFTELTARVDAINQHGSLPMQGLTNRLNAIESHLERQDTANRALAERVARLEGPVKRIADAADGGAT